jgi:hypothetical protein
VVRNSSKLLLLCACLGAAFFLRFEPALAGPLPFLVTPTRGEFVASPGEQKTGGFVFTNKSDHQVEVQIGSADFQATDELGHIAIGQPENAASSLIDWVHPSVSKINVPAGAFVRIGFSLDVPLGAAPGGHWGAVLVTSKPELREGDSAEQTSIAYAILLNVRGDALEKVSIASFSAPRFVEAPPIAFTARFKNEGALHERPHAVLEIRNIFGRVVASGVFSDEHVLPDAVRKVERPFGAGFWFGRYTARLTATYADGAKSVEAQTTFWVVPWKKMLPAGLGVFVILVVSGFVLWWRRRLAKG